MGRPLAVIIPSLNRLYLHKEPDSGGGLPAADDLLHVREVKRDIADRSKLFLKQKINQDRPKLFLELYINKLGLFKIIFLKKLYS